MGYAAQRRRQTSAIFQEYTQISGKTIEQALKSEMSGDILNGLLDIGMFLRFLTSNFQSLFKEPGFLIPKIR